MRHLFRVWWLRLARNAGVLWGTSIFATVAAVLCAHFDLLDLGNAERGAFDDGLTALTEWTSTPQPSEDIIIVAIDDLTLQAVAKNEGYARNFGSWPYSRNIWARVFEHLDNEGARAIVFDAVMDERNTDPSGDIGIGETVAAIDTPVFLGFNVSQSSSTQAPAKVATPTNRRPKKSSSDETNGSGPSDGDEAPDAEETFEEETFEEETFEEETFEEETFEEESFDDAEESFEDAGGETFADADGFPTASADAVAQALAFPVEVDGLELPSLADEEGRMRYPLAPIAPLIDPMSGFGLVITEEDDDGKMRRTRFAYQDGVNTYVTLSVAVVADLWAAEKIRLTPGRLQIGDRAIPINPTGDAEIAYGGTLEERFKAISLIHVLDDWLAVEQARQKGGAEKPDKKLEDGVFKDKVVIIAGFALGTADVKPTPFAAQSPGVIKQAAEIQNLLDGRFIVEAPFWVSVLVTFLIAFFSVAIVLVFQQVLLEVGYPLALFYGFFLVTGVFLVHQQLHILSAMPSYAAAFCGTVIAIYNHVFISRERERLKDAFAGRVKDEYLEEMVEQKTVPKLDGEFREVSLLITDINDFSRLARHYEDDPEQLARIMKAYLTVVTDVLLEHGGHVIKYLGDTVECVFGAPLDQRDHALRACRAAIAVVEAADSMPFDVPGAEKGVFYTRTGVVTARCFVGNFGSEQAPEYTVLGGPMREAVGVARANEHLRTRILLGPETVRQAQDHINARERATLELVPGQPEVSLYELEGMKT